MDAEDRNNPQSHVAQDAWEYYAKTVLSPELDEGERAAAKRAFFAGGFLLVSVMRTVVEQAGTQPADRALETIRLALDVLRNELDGDLPDDAGTPS